MKRVTYNITRCRLFFLNFLCFLFFVLCFTFHVPQIFAQQVSLSISPPLIEVLIKPGKSALIAYTLENHGDPVIVTTSVRSFVPKDHRGNINLSDEIEGPVRFSLDNADIGLDQPFFLKTRDRQQLLLRVRIPEGAPDGDYYYTLLAQTDPLPVKEGQSASRAQAGIGANILVTVTESGQVEVKGKISLFELLARWKLKLGRQMINLFDSSDKISLILIVDNKGKNLIKPLGEITLRGSFGEKASYEIIPQNILAESQRQLQATPSAEMDCDQPRKLPAYCRQPISLLLSGFFLGKYTLSTTINFGEGTPNLFASTSFIAIPIKLLTAVSLTIIVSILIIKKLNKSNDW